MELSERYSLIQDGPRHEEIVLLQGRGCFWKKCSFCDYYHDGADDQTAETLNRIVLEKITGATGWLTVLNSGSWFELPEATQQCILKICKDKHITDLSFETHWAYHEKTRMLKQTLANQGITAHPRIGIETFHTNMRENVFVKGMGNPTAEDIANIYTECCLLYGYPGQTKKQLHLDVETALHYFDHIYLNIYNSNSKGPEPDNRLIADFIAEDYPKYLKNEKITILIENTGLGVGD